MKPLPLTQWDTSNRHIADDMGGQPLNVHALFAHHPTLLNAWWPLRQYLVNATTLPGRLAEILILRIAVRTETWYEWASHVDRGLAVGLNLAEIKNVRAIPDGESWSANEKTLIQAADQLFERQAIEPELLQELGQHFESQQILDIIAIHGMYMTLACVLRTWDTTVDAHVLERLPPEITRASFVDD